MAYEIVWTERAISGFNDVVTYLNTNWTDREVSNFINETQEFLTLLSDFPNLLQKTSKYKNVHRGPLNKLTVITYRVKVKKIKSKLSTFAMREENQNKLWHYSKILTQP